MTKKQKFKWDADRLAIAFLTIVFAVIIRALTHNLMRFETVNFNLSIWVSPILGLLLAQYIIERELDFREMGIFFIAFVVILNLLNFAPAIKYYDLFAIQMNAKSGVLFSAGVYLIAIPLSVISSDWITDKIKKRK